MEDVCLGLDWIWEDISETLRPTTLGGDVKEEDGELLGDGTNIKWVGSMFNYFRISASQGIHLDIELVDSCLLVINTSQEGGLKS